MRYGLGEETISLINSVFATHPSIKEVKIYGSRAKGNYRIGSDIDLCIFADTLSNDELSRIKNELDDLPTLYGIDLCDYDKVENAELKEHIDRVGKCFYAKATVIKDMQID
jgi:predicted nucleotidyltransferase